MTILHELDRKDVDQIELFRRCQEVEKVLSDSHNGFANRINELKKEDDLFERKTAGFAEDSGVLSCLLKGEEQPGENESRNQIDDLNEIARVYAALPEKDQTLQDMQEELDKQRNKNLKKPDRKGLKCDRKISGCSADYENREHDINMRNLKELDRKGIQSDQIINHSGEAISPSLEQDKLRLISR